MNITVNGETHDVPENSTLADLLKSLRINRQHVAVEVNAQLVAREQHEQHRLLPDDALEIVTLVGGG